jgi:hypothetical protein
VYAVDRWLIYGRACHAKGTAASRHRLNSFSVMLYRHWYSTSVEPEWRKHADEIDLRVMFVVPEGGVYGFTGDSCGLDVTVMELKVSAFCLRRRRYIVSCLQRRTTVHRPVVPVKPSGT